MKTILYADDNQEIIDLVMLALVGSGYRLITARNGDEAVRACREMKPDLVLMDLNMPGLSGFDTIVRMRADGYAKPIVVLTASESAEDRRKARAVGCDDYVLKTLDMNDLGNIVERYLAEPGALDLS
jgi:CheY-like chemotaxis protein